MQYRRDKPHIGPLLHLYKIGMYCPNHFPQIMWGMMGYNQQCWWKPNTKSYIVRIQTLNPFFHNLIHKEIRSEIVEGVEKKGEKKKKELGVWGRSMVNREWVGRLSVGGDVWVKKEQTVKKLYTPLSGPTHLPFSTPQFNAVTCPSVSFLTLASTLPIYGTIPHFDSFLMLPTILEKDKTNCFSFSFFGLLKKF